MKPLCFVLMPFGRKPDSQGRITDFDAVYRELIAPAVSSAGMECIRADEEQVGGTIHKPMFERLLMCDYAVADLTGANPNVYYELGVRHAIKPRSTLILFAEGTTLPFDLAPLRGLPYQTDASGMPTQVAANLERLSLRLAAAKKDANDDSPVYQFIDYMPRVSVDHTRTDLFRTRADHSRVFKERLEAARARGSAAVIEILDDPALSDLTDVEAGIVVDLFLSLRSVKAYEQMIALFNKMQRPLQRNRMIREQLAFAQNRLGRYAEAQTTLEEVIQEYGVSSETNGLLGRVYKDRWENACRDNKMIQARGFMKQAIECYLQGFKADWRDPYPGINALTLMELGEKPDPRHEQILPVVRFAAQQRIQSKPDYWDYATLLELAVHARDEEDAAEMLALALTLVRESWELETTERNLRLLREARERRGETQQWIAEIEHELGTTRKELE